MWKSTTWPKPEFFFFSGRCWTILEHLLKQDTFVGEREDGKHPERLREDSCKDAVENEDEDDESAEEEPPKAAAPAAAKADDEDSGDEDTAAKADDEDSGDEAAAAKADGGCNWRI